MNEPAPKDLAALFADFDSVKEDIAFLRALRNLKVATAKGDLALRIAPNAENIVLDLRSLTPATVDTGLPDQSGNSGKVLGTDGSKTTWVAAGGASQYTRASRGAVQAIANGVFTTVSFDSAPNNDSGIWSAGSPTRLTVPAGQGGLWFGFGRISYQANANGSRYIYLLQNGVGTIFLNNSAAIPNGNPSYAAFSFLLPLAAGDYVEMQGYQDSGGGLNMSSGGDTSLAITRVGA